MERRIPKEKVDAFKKQISKEDTQKSIEYFKEIHGIDLTKTNRTERKTLILSHLHGASAAFMNLVGDIRSRQEEK